MTTFDIYSLEAELINNSKRKLSCGTPLTPMKKLRLLCLSRGVGGFGSLARTFVKMDIDQKENLTPETFKEAIITAGYTEMEDTEIDELYENFDNSKDFFHELRPKVPVSRSQAIDKAYSKMDSANKGYIDFATFKKSYNLEKHRQFHNSNLSKDQLLRKILDNFENDKISTDDFLNYCSAISAQIDKDAYFDLLMKECYHLNYTIDFELVMVIFIGLFLM